MYIESDSNVFDGGTISYLLKIQQLLQMYFSKFINNKQAQNLCIAAHFKLWHVVFKQRQTRAKLSQNGQKGANMVHIEL